jgi:hypothetical protein
MPLTAKVTLPVLPLAAPLGEGALSPVGKPETTQEKWSDPGTPLKPTVTVPL